MVLPKYNSKALIDTTVRKDIREMSPRVREAIRDVTTVTDVLRSSFHSAYGSESHLRRQLSRQRLSALLRDFSAGAGGFRSSQIKRLHAQNALKMRPMLRVGNGEIANAINVVRRKMGTGQLRRAGGLRFGPWGTSRLWGDLWGPSTAFEG
jgi:hypothetical protein